MLLDPSTAFAALTAAGVGVVHTLLGPDHYLPFVALRRAESWSAKKTLSMTAVFGVLHVGAAAAIALIALRSGGAFTWIAEHARERAVAVGLLWIAFAAALWLRSSRTEKAGSLRGTSGLLAAAALVGPCEWLWPTLSAMNTQASILSVGAVVGAFAAATIATMTLTVYALSTGFSATFGAFSKRTLDRVGAAFVAAAGVLMIAGF